MELRISRASAVVVQRVPTADADWFLEWQRGITAAAEGFAGYRGTDLYPPADKQHDEWVIVIHFDDDPSLQNWLASPARAEWVDRLRKQASTFEVQAMPGGFGPWFTSTRRPVAPPPAWKMVLTVLLGLYPTVMLLTLFPGPYTSRLGFAVSMLIGNALSVSILQWVVMPVLNPLFAGWLHADPKKDVWSAGGLVLILALLAVMATVFHLAGIHP